MPFEYLDDANIVKTRDGDYYIIILFENRICFMNNELFLGTDIEYDRYLKSRTDDNSFDIVALYKCEYNTELNPFKLLELKDDWELIWEEDNDEITMIADGKMIFKL